MAHETTRKTGDEPAGGTDPGGTRPAPKPPATQTPATTTPHVESGDRNAMTTENPATGKPE